MTQGLTWPNRELRMVRKLMSDAEDAALDLRERREELQDSGTRLQEDGDRLLTCGPPRPPAPPSAGAAALWPRGSQSGARSSVLSDREGTLGTGRGCVWQRRGRSAGSAGPAAGGRSSRTCFRRWWCRCAGLDVRQRSLTPLGSGGSGPWPCAPCDLHLPRATAPSPPSWLPTSAGWHSGLRALTSHSAGQEEPSALGRWWWC